MPRAELLRSKKNELASCLLSRKRKLSELYFATVSLVDPEAAPKEPSYLEEEQAFLNANDLAKGLYFNDATLPSRPDITSIPLPSTFPDSISNLSQPFAETRHESRSDHAASSVDAEAAQKLSRSKAEGRDATTKGSQVRKDGNTSPGTASKALQTESDLEAVESSTDLMQVDVPAASEPFERSRIETRVESPGGSPGVDPSRTGTRSKDDIASALPFGEDRKPIQEAEGALRGISPSRDKLLSPRKHGDARQPNGAVSSSLADQASSPASTVGPYSSNTPGIAVASPDTSPEGEDRPERRSDVRFPPPTKLPPTPEDQTQASQQVLPEPIASTTIDTTSGQSQLPTQDAAPVSEQSPSAMPPPSRIVHDHVPPSSAANSSLAEAPRIGKRPSMRIDTQSVGNTDSPIRAAASMVESPMSLASAPQKGPLASAALQSPPDRPRTRVSSGTIRQKSVSEILGETPRPSPSQSEKAGELSRAASFAESPASQNSALIRSAIAERKEREKERSRLSTVVFAKQNQAVEGIDQSELLQQILGESSEGQLKDRDYLNSLFEARAYSPPRATQLSQLLSSAHKSLSTSDHMVEYMEQTNCRTLRRIYQLQNANRWPLRQMERHPEPDRPTSHWDFVLDHMKWMRTDFREERKWKFAAAKGCAEWCAEYVASTQDQRELLRIKTKRPKFLPRSAPDEEMEDVSEEEDEEAEPTPELVPSAEDESVDDGSVADPRHEFDLINAPAAIFSLGPADFTFSFNKTPAAEKILNELRLYQPARIEPDLGRSDLGKRHDSLWKKDILPISKFAVGKIRMPVSKPPRKRSRYEYELEDESDSEIIPMEPEQMDVALFLPENKHLRERIHPGNSFRPPTDHPMPSQSFFESRNSSQWTHAEDDELRRLVREYSYNWSLISSVLSSPSQYHSGADRRTSWECFERWISLEGLPPDMSKIPYFRTYHARLEAAGQKVLANLQAQQAQAAPGVNLRRRTTQPIRVERKRNSKYLALLDAMRKLAKKRETALQKQQHSASMSAMRKTNEAAQPRPRISTPAEFSQLKHERDQKMLERQEAYRQQVLASQRASQLQRAQLAQAYPNGQARSANGVVANGSSPIAGSSIPANLPNGHPQAGNPAQARPNSMHGIPNGVPNGSHPDIMAMQALRGGALPPNMQRAPVNSPESARVLYEAKRLTAEQQRILAQQRNMAQQQANGSSPNLPMATMNGGSPNNPAMLAAMAAASGMGSPNLNPSNGNAGSPRMAQAQALSSGMTPAINSLAAQISAQRPDLTTEQVQQQATNRLMQLHAQQQQRAQTERRMNQAALNAAAGAQNAGALANNGNYSHDGSGAQRGVAMMTNEQVRAYQNYMRTHQAEGMRNLATAGSAGGGGSPVMNGVGLARAAGNADHSLTPQQPTGKSPSLQQQQQATAGQ